MPSIATAAAQTPPSQDDNPGGQRHLPALDGLRGTAILLILYCHLFASNPHSGNRFFDFMNQLVASSWIGVNLFFALSGFLITGILLSTLHHSNYFKIFYARRSLRIFPLYYGFVLFLFALSWPLHFQWNGWQYYTLTYTTNLALWRYGIPLVTPHFNIHHFWSLDAEEQFYLIWPFIVYRVKSIPRLITITLYTCLAILALRTTLVLLHDYFANPYLVYSPTFCCADNLLFGSCLAMVLRSPWRQRALSVAPRVFAVCVVFLAIVFVIYGSLDFQVGKITPSIGLSAVGIAATALIAMSLKNASITQSIFNNSVLRFFGRYSYGLYIYHYSIKETIETWLRAWFGNNFHSKAAGVLGAAVVVAVLSILISVASYHLFEVRFLRLKKYFAYASPDKPEIAPA